MGVKKSAVWRSRPPPNGMYPASSRVSIPLTNPSTAVGASPLRACSRSPGANLDAQPALVEYFVSLMRVRSSIDSQVYSRATSMDRSQDDARDGRGPEVASPSPAEVSVDDRRGPVLYSGKLPFVRVAPRIHSGSRRRL